MQSCRCLRWFFNVSAWEPAETEWLKAIESIQLDELCRAKKFHFKTDVKTAVIGRLLLRQAAHHCLGLKWKDIVLLRTDAGKPYLKSLSSENNNDSNINVNIPFSFNISHHGDFVVLGTSCASNCGVDLMKTDLDRLSTLEAVENYLRLMRRQFAEEEFRTLEKQSTIEKKMAYFYRYWCLKESYVKATGQGLRIPLRQLNFQFHTPELSTEHRTCDTTLEIGGNLSQQWTFEEWLLGSDHIATLCTDFISNSNCQRDKIKFVPIKFSHLVDGAEPLHVVVSEEWEQFKVKPLKEPVAVKQSFANIVF